jgi:cardiolipin synthase
MRARQQDYIDRSVAIDHDAVARWSRGRQFWNNAIAMFGPVL